MKSIYDYTNYRAYLTDYYNWAKQHLRSFSHRAFLEKAGMSGPNYLKRVMEGVHKLTDNSIPKFCKALDLSESEANYFKHLVYLPVLTVTKETLSNTRYPTQGMSHP